MTASERRRKLVEDLKKHAHASTKATRELMVRAIKEIVDYDKRFQSSTP
ncbi:hypothetical protein [Stenotrophomonas phage CM2]